MKIMVSILFFSVEIDIWDEQMMKWDFVKIAPVYGTLLSHLRREDAYKKKGTL